MSDYIKQLEEQNEELQKRLAEAELLIATLRCDIKILRIACHD